MADTLYPLGRPSAGQLDRTDLLFHDLRSEIRRGRDPLDPPPEFDVDPDLIPEHLWRKAQAAEIVRQAESLAVLTSSQDLAFNARLQHVQEVSTAAVTADVLRIRILEAAHKRGRDSDLNSAVMDRQEWWSTRYLPPEEIRFRSAHLGIDTEKLTLDEQLKAMEREAIEARREADRLRASEGALDVVELANVLQRERRSREAVSLLGPRDPGSIGQFLTQAVFPVIEVLDRPFNAVRGLLVGEDPMDSIRNSWLGISGQEHYLGRDIGFVRLLPDNDFLPFSLSARDVAGGAVEFALDLAVVGKAAKVVRTVRRTVPQGVAPPTYVAPARHITEYADEVVTSDSPLVRAIVGRSGINPAVLENTPVGRIAVGYKVHQIADENLAEIAVSAAYDPWSVRFAGIAPVGRGRVGHLFELSDDGVIRNLQGAPGFEDASRAWNDVFSNPDRYVMTLDQRRFLGDVHKLIDDVEAMRVAEGLPARARNTDPAGWFYTPRNVVELDGLVTRGSNPAMKRVYEEMAEGLANGVRYATDVRAVLAAHARGAYAEVRDHQLREALEPHILPRPEVGAEFVFGVHGDRIPVRAWRNIPLERADAETMARVLGDLSLEDPGNVFARGFTYVADARRTHSAIADFAAPFIQGVPLLGRSPQKWAESTLRHYLAFFDPTVQSRFIRENIDTFQDMARYGVPVGDNEFFTALRSGANIFDALDRGVGRLPGLGNIPQVGDDVSLALQALKSQSFGRFQASYDMFLTTTRALMWQGYKDSWIRSGSTLQQLARHIRNMSGGLDSKALGASANQRSVESTLLAFAPRLLRSTAALGVELFSRDRTLQLEAWRMLGQVTAGAIGMYVLSGIALDKDKDEIGTGLNPLEGKKFLSHEINGDWIGIGSQVRAFMQLFWAVASDPPSLAETDFSENPLAEFYSNRAAPGVAIARAVAETASGGRIDALAYDRVETRPDLARHLATETLPFALQGWLEGEAGITVGAAVLGARTSPQTPGERQTEILDVAMQVAGFTGSFAELAETDGRNATLQRMRAVLRDTDPDALAELDAITATQERETLRDAANGDKLAEGLAASITARENIRAFVDEHPDDPIGLRFAVSEETTKARGVREQPGVQEALDATFDPETEVQQDIARFFEIAGLTDPDERFHAEAEFMGEVGAARYDRVLANVYAVTKDVPPGYLELQRTKRELAAPGSLWTRDDVAWAEVQRRTGGTTTDYPTFFAWRDAQVARLEAAITPAIEEAAGVETAEGLRRAVALDVLEHSSAEPEGMFVHMVMSQEREKFERRWIVEHIDDGLTAAAAKFGYLQTSRQDRAVIIQLAGQGETVPTATPTAEPPAVGSALEDLTQADRALVESWVSGKSYAEVGAEFDVTQGAAQQRLRRIFRLMFPETTGSPVAARGRLRAQRGLPSLD